MIESSLTSTSCLTATADAATAGWSLTKKYANIKDHVLYRLLFSVHNIYRRLLNLPWVNDFVIRDAKLRK